MNSQCVYAMFAYLFLCRSPPPPESSQLPCCARSGSRLSAALHTCLECCWEALGIIPLSTHIHTHTHALIFASGIWVCFTWVSTKVSRLNVYSGGNHSPNTKVTVCHMTSLMENKPCEIIIHFFVLRDLFIPKGTVRWSNYACHHDAHLLYMHHIHRISYQG